MCVSDVLYFKMTANRELLLSTKAGHKHCTNPNSNEVGMSVKIEYNDFQILFNLYSIEYTTKIFNVQTDILYAYTYNNM